MDISGQINRKIRKFKCSNIKVVMGLPFEYRDSDGQRYWCQHGHHCHGVSNLTQSDQCQGLKVNKNLVHSARGNVQILSRALGKHSSLQIELS